MKLFPGKRPGIQDKKWIGLEHQHTGLTTKLFPTAGRDVVVRKTARLSVLTVLTPDHQFGGFCLFG